MPNCPFVFVSPPNRSTLSRFGSNTALKAKRALAPVASFFHASGEVNSACPIALGPAHSTNSLAHSANLPASAGGDDTHRIVADRASKERTRGRGCRIAKLNE